MLRFLKTLLKRNLKKRQKTIEIINDVDMVIEIDRANGAMIIKANRELTQEEIIAIMKKVL